MKPLKESPIHTPFRVTKPWGTSLPQVDLEELRSDPRFGRIASISGSHHSTVKSCRKPNVTGRCSRAAIQPADRSDERSNRIRTSAPTSESLSDGWLTLPNTGRSSEISGGISQDLQG